MVAGPSVPVSSVAFRKGVVFEGGSLGFLFPLAGGGRETFSSLLPRESRKQDPPGVDGSWERLLSLLRPLTRPRSHEISRPEAAGPSGIRQACPLSRNSWIFPGPGSGCSPCPWQGFLPHSPPRQLRAGRPVQTPGCRAHCASPWEFGIHILSHAFCRPVPADRGLRAHGCRGRVPAR